MNFTENEKQYIGNENSNTSFKIFNFEISISIFSAIGYCILNNKFFLNLIKNILYSYLYLK